MLAALVLALLATSEPSPGVQERPPAIAASLRGCARFRTLRNHPTPADPGDGLGPAKLDLPRRELAQAEPAPVPAAPMPAVPPEPPAVPEPPPPPLRSALGVSLQLAHRLAEGGPTLDPFWGFSLAGRYERRLLAAQTGLELGAAVDFSFQRFTTSVVGSTMIAPGMEMTFDGTRLITETTFALLPTVAFQAGPVRPFAGAGVGLGVGFFSTAEIELRPGSQTAVQPLVRGAAGVDVALSATSAITIRADYSHMFTRPDFVTDTGQRYSLFGDLLDIGVGLLLRF